LSIAVTVIIVVVPSTNVDPHGISVEIDETPQLSVANKDQLAVGVHSDNTISSGQSIIGNSTSVTVTFIEQLVVFPDPSVTVHVTVVVPSG
jgi:hypothetical protein